MCYKLLYFTTLIVTKTAEKRKYRMAKLGAKCGFALLVVVWAMLSCSPTKYVPEGEYLLDKVNIHSDVKGISSLDLSPYVKQNPNYKTFALYKLPLGLYSLSGRDSGRFYNRWLKSIGEPPVLFDSAQVIRTEQELQRVFVNKGYINAQVQTDVKKANRKVEVKYVIQPDTPYVVTNYDIHSPDSLFEHLGEQRSGMRAGQEQAIGRQTLMQGTLVKPGMLFDLNVLDEERQRVVELFRQNGYYSFNKEYVGFVADTLTDGNHQVHLQMVFYPFAVRRSGMPVEERKHRRYTIKSLRIYMDYDPLRDGILSEYAPMDSTGYEHCSIFWGEMGRYLQPSVLMEAVHLRPQMEYDDKRVDMTYNSLARLAILRNINIRFFADNDEDKPELHCVITCYPDKRQGFIAEVEGTNTTGYFGVATSLTYRHRNVFKGAETYNLKLHGAFDAISSNSYALRDNNYEIGAEMSLTFPRLLMPFLSKDFKRRSNASTQIATSYTYQSYPNYYERTILSAGIKYIWQNQRNPLSKQTLDLLELSYVHFPYLSGSFFQSLPQYTQIYSFRDQFIASIGYSYTHSNFNPLKKSNRPIHSFRGAVETGGNSLALASRLLNIAPDTLGSRKVFGTYFAQYAKANADYSNTIFLDRKNSVAWRLGGGIVVPYGNSVFAPIQKRFFSGGASSVRAWNVRELGPGDYYDANANFFNHAGDIRLDANVEYRSKVFWKLELAAFLDAGNVWTVRNYSGNNDGVFRFQKFYKQIAAGWGLGVRFDFDFVLIRLDCGWKLYDPAEGTGRTKWQVMYPHKLAQNTAWHIAVGYPF